MKCRRCGKTIEVPDGTTPEREQAIFWGHDNVCGETEGSGRILVSEPKHWDAETR
jgi:hypothetical protein